MRPHYILLAAILAASAGLAHAGDAANGATLFRKCLACHTATEARNKVGPNLVGVIDRPVASVAGFRYSKAMKAYSAGKTWTEADLTHSRRGLGYDPQFDLDRGVDAYAKSGQLGAD